MDLNQMRKLTLDKIETDLFTNNVRQSIKQNIRERQNKREAFKDAFEVLLESQEASTQTQKDILEELKKLNNEMRENIQEQREEPIEEEELTETSEDEDSEDSEGESRPHFRLPGLLYRGFKGLVSRVNPSTATTLIRNGLIGTAGIASAIAATKYLGEQLSDRTGNERFGTSFDVMEPSVMLLKIIYTNYQLKQHLLFIIKRGQRVMQSPLVYQILYTKELLVLPGLMLHWLLIILLPIVYPSIKLVDLSIK